MRLSASWSLLGDDWSKRSSHVVGFLSPSHGVVFGGELEPHRPLPPASYAYPLLPNFPRRKNSELPSTGDVPAGRVGAVFVPHGEADTFWMWGGCCARVMKPLEGEEAGWYIVRYRNGRSVWEYVKDSKGDIPNGRIYCAGAIAGDTIYVHAGRLLHDRLNDLYAYDIPTKTWSRLADAPDDPRSGTALVASRVFIDGSEQDVLLRWGGYADRTLGEDNALGVYVLSTNTWHSFTPNCPAGMPGPRSVQGFVSLNIASPEDDPEKALALMWMGERAPASDRPDGVALYWDDVWALLQVPNVTDTSGGFLWRYLDTPRKSRPQGRGWFAATNIPVGAGERDTLARVLMHGGLISSNEPSSEAWLLEVRRES